MNTFSKLFLTNQTNQTQTTESVHMTTTDLQGSFFQTNFTFIEIPTFSTKVLSNHSDLRTRIFRRYIGNKNSASKRPAFVTVFLQQEFLSPGVFILQENNLN